MSVTSGVYTIRWPEANHQGWVTTARDIDDSLYEEALPVTDVRLLQKWRVIRLEGEGDLYMILKAGDEGPPGGFGIEKARNGAPVKFKTQPSVWHIAKKGETYTINLVGGTGDNVLTVALINPWGIAVRRLTLHSHCDSCAHEAFGWVFDPVKENETKKTEKTAEKAKE